MGEQREGIRGSLVAMMCDCERMGNSARWLLAEMPSLYFSYELNHFFFNFGHTYLTPLTGPTLKTPFIDWENAGLATIICMPILGKSAHHMDANGIPS